MTTKSKTTFAFVRPGCLTLLALLVLLRPALAVDTNAAPAADDKNLAPAEAASQDLLRSTLQIQEQLQATQIAIETNRLAAEAEAARNARLLDARLRALEKTVATEHVEQVSGMNHSERTTLLAAGGFAVIGFLVLLTSLLQWTAVNRLAAAASRSAAYAPPGLGTSQAQLAPAHALEQSNTRFLGLLERLEQRIHQLEASVTLPKILSAGDPPNGQANPPGAESSPAEIPPAVAPENTDPVSLLISKSQTLLKFDQPEAAVGCLDEVLALDPGNADALVKKGAALERLQLFDQAIQCYDRAIAQDNSMTMAYLYKGGILNRMERHGEALACYEQALQLGKTARPQAS